VSIKIAVVCEDHTHDQYVAKPVIEKLMAHLDKPRANVFVVNDPRLTGYSTVKSKACLILQRYGGIVDLVIFAVDSDGHDGQEGRPSRKKSLEDLVSECPDYSEKALIVSAVQEMEVWALWGSRSELGDRWQDVRAERDPKEAYLHVLQTDADLKSPGEGRARLTARSLQVGWRSLIQGCPELGQLTDEVRAKLGI
jgi:hypothetical protein